MKDTTSRHYIDDTALLEAMRNYQLRCKEAEDAGKEIPKVPNYIGKCFILLARKIGNARSFSSYTFREDMEGDAIIACLKSVRNFDVDSYEKPFAYFTTVVRNAFLARIRYEKRKLYTVFKASREAASFGGTYESGEDEVSPLYLGYSSTYIDDFIKDFEIKDKIRQERIREKVKEKVALKKSSSGEHVENDDTDIDDVVDDGEVNLENFFDN